MQLIRFTHLGVAGLLLAAASLTLCAQETSPQPRRPNAGLPPERPLAEGRFMQQGQQNLALRVMNEEQLASYRQAMQTGREQLRALENKLFEARKELTIASVAEKFDENLVRAKAMVVAKLDAEMAVVRARAMSQIKPPLSADQIEKVKNLPNDGGGGVGLRPRQMGAGAEAGAPAIRPQQRAPRRDENDLPATAPVMP